MSQIFAKNKDGKYEWMDKDAHKALCCSGNTSAAVWDDYDYQGVAFPGNPRVTSRSQHRELLKRHGCVEMGTEKPNFGGHNA